MKKALILLVVLIMALQGIAAFAEAADTEVSNEATEVKYDNNELTVGTVTPFDGKFFTQLWGNDSTDLDVQMLIHGYETIEWNHERDEFRVDPTVVTDLVAEKNTETGDRRFTITFADDLYYSDGTKITARDYAFSILLQIAPEMEELGGKIRPKDYLWGYEDYAAGKAKALSGVRVLAENKLQIYVKSRYLPYFYELTLIDSIPYPIHVIAPGCVVKDDGNGAYIANADGAAKERVFTAELLKETILNEATGYLSHPSVSSGPYRLVSYDGDTAEFEINKYYKGNSKGIKPTIRKLIFKVADNGTMIDELSRGEYGLLNRCVSAEVLEKGEELAAGDTFTKSEYDRSGMSFIAFCCEQEPVSSLAVRQAIAYCLDKDGLVKDVVGEYGQRVDGYYGIGQWMYRLIGNEENFPMEELAADANQAAKDSYDKELAKWKEIGLEGVTVYNLDTEAAIKLLESDGWTLNRSGDVFNAEMDDVRCKEVDGTLTALELKMLVPEGSSMNKGFQANFVDHLAEAGILLSIEEMPMQSLLREYYRLDERSCHMIALASNFDLIFEPSLYFKPDTKQGINNYNTTGQTDSRLYDLLMDMRKTESSDLLGYCQKWVEFQKGFQEVLPMLSLYSNTYYDFYPSVLQDYDPAGNVSWSKAIIASSIGD